MPFPRGLCSNAKATGEPAWSTSPPASTTTSGRSTPSCDLTDHAALPNVELRMAEVTGHDFERYGLPARRIPQMRVNYLVETLAVCRIVPVGAETECIMPKATGFFVEVRESLFLVTNKHVITARDFFRPERHLYGGATPGKLVLHVFLYRALGSGEYIYGDALYEFSLYDSGNPRFLLVDDPEPMDVAVVPLGRKEELKSKMSGFSFATLGISKIKPRPMDTVFVAGHPDTGIFNETGYCIYKSGIVASEPDIGFRGGAILIDAATKRGMSGSPVLHKPANIFANHAGLIGVYSGRDEDGTVTGNSELGIMWPIDEVLRFIDAKTATK